MPRTFLPLDQRLPGSSSHDLLGCIVADPRNPFGEYIPSRQSPSEILKDAQVDTVLETDIYSVLDSRYGANLRVKLEKLLNIKREGSGATSRIFSADCVRTTRFRNHNEVYRRLIANSEVNTGLRDMLKRGNGQVYMVVGVKTCYDGKFITSVNDKFAVTAEATLPVQEIAGALNTLAYVGKITDPKISVDVWKQLHTASVAKGVGEQVFAVEYRLIWRRVVRPPVMRNLIMPNDGMFAADADEVVSEDVVEVDGEDYELAADKLAGMFYQDTLLFSLD
ncbi:Fc.00g116460.m01.CDS01 [Cosmosporella sp. VM-42]